MILVTGTSGVLGRAVLDALDRRGEPYFAVRSADVDLRDAGATLELFERVRPQLVIHMAAKVHGLGGNTRYMAEMFTDNVRINTNVVDATHRCGCRRIVAVSTVATYASDVPRPVREAAIWSGPPHASEAAYGHAKRAMLAQLDAYHQQYGLSFAYPLMTNIYGRHDRFDALYGHVIPSLVAKFHQAALEGGSVSVWGTGKAERDFLHATDAANAILLLKEDFEGPINIVTGKVHLIREVVDLLVAHTGVERIEWDMEKPDGQILRRYDSSLIESLGFRQEVSLAEGLSDTYDWFADHYPNVRGAA